MAPSYVMILGVSTAVRVIAGSIRTAVFQGTCRSRARRSTIRQDKAQ